jgi:hypothetical protein
MPVRRRASLCRPRSTVQAYEPYETAQNKWAMTHFTFGEAQLYFQCSSFALGLARGVPFRKEFRQKHFPPAMLCSIAPRRSIGTCITRRSQARNTCSAAPTVTNSERSLLNQRDNTQNDCDFRQSRCGGQGLQPFSCYTRRPQQFSQPARLQFRASFTQRNPTIA